MNRKPWDICLKQGIAQKPSACLIIEWSRAKKFLVQFQFVRFGDKKAIVSSSNDQLPRLTTAAVAINSLSKAMDA